jgi:nicotinic acid mononucleotide adenylyltransferase
MPVVDISSSFVRQQLMAGGEAAQMPASVIELITAENVYKGLD